MAYLLRVRVEDVPPAVFLAALFFAGAFSGLFFGGAFFAGAVAFGGAVFLPAVLAGAAGPVDRLAGEALFAGAFLAA
ncbi:hypothetical protein, partial [Kitasatospora indigofera]|uniref:hypothetical protein n=1 Tax=Kitasatospora indigofera TaxID=67307 RepID=UPI0036893EED